MVNQQAVNQNFFKWALFMVIVLDAVGFGIVTPVLAPMIRHVSSLIGQSGSSLVDRHLLYGVILALYPLSYIIGAPLMGSLSDRWGRRPLLIICLVGSLVGFIGYALSLNLQSLTLLMIGRVLTGVTAGSQGIAQAAMVDISSSSREKAINIGLIAIAMTLGLVLGPLLGGVLADNNLVAWFHLATPFYCVIILCFINLGLLLWGVADTTYISDTKPINQVNFKDGLRLIIKTPAVVSLLLVFFLFEIGWSLYYQSLPIVWVHQFHASQIGVGLFLAYVGLMLCVGLFILVRLLTHYLTIVNCVQVSLLVGGVALIILQLIATGWAQFILAIPMTFAVALGYTGIITLISNQLPEGRQGLLMGLTDALLALAFAGTILLASWITVYALYAPFVIAALVWWLALARLRVIKEGGNV